MKKSAKTRIQAADEKTLTRWVGLDCAIVAPAAHFPHPVGRGKRLLSSETLEEVFAES